MHEIICPNCKTAFQIDEAGYADILNQVRDEDFQRQLEQHYGTARWEKESAVELAVTKIIIESEKAVMARLRNRGTLSH